MSLDGNLPPDTDSRLSSSESVLSFLTDLFLLTWTVQGKFYLAEKFSVQHLMALHICLFIKNMNISNTVINSLLQSNLPVLWYLQCKEVRNMWNKNNHELVFDFPGGV